MGLIEEEIRNIELAIGLKLPVEVHERYLVSNGFLGPKNCQLLYTYGVDLRTDIVEINNKLRGEDWWPDGLRDLVLVGCDGVGGLIGYDYRIQRGVLWYPVEGEHYDLVKASVSEIWEAVIAMYKSDS